MPKVASNLLETLARVWPPMILLRMRKPCMEKTFNTLGRIPSQYLPYQFEESEVH